MTDPQLEARRVVLEDSARLNRLLGAVILAHMLEDEVRLENLLDQVDLRTCEGIAAAVLAEARRLRPGGAASSPHVAPLDELDGIWNRELASAAAPVVRRGGRS